jgi:hypothetical protein
MPTKTKIIIAAVVIVVMGIGAYLFFGRSANTASYAALTGSGANVSVSMAQANFQEMSSKLGPATFDTSIFTNPQFTSLVDFHVTTIPEPIGRPDPFATLP